MRTTSTESHTCALTFRRETLLWLMQVEYFGIHDGVPYHLFSPALQTDGCNLKTKGNEKIKPSVAAYTNKNGKSTNIQDTREEGLPVGYQSFS